MNARAWSTFGVPRYSGGVLAAKFVQCAQSSGSFRETSVIMRDLEKPHGLFMRNFQKPRPCRASDDYIVRARIPEVIEVRDERIPLNRDPFLKSEPININCLVAHPQRLQPCRCTLQR